MYDDENAVCGCDRTSEQASKQEKEGRQTLKVIFQEWQQVWQIPLQAVWDFISALLQRSRIPLQIFRLHYL